MSSTTMMSTSKDGGVLPRMLCTVLSNIEGASLYIGITTLVKCTDEVVVAVHFKYFLSIDCPNCACPWNFTKWTFTTNGQIYRLSYYNINIYRMWNVLTKNAMLPKSISLAIVLEQVDKIIWVSKVNTAWCRTTLTQCVMYGIISSLVMWYKIEGRKKAHWVHLIP